jgi:serine/threonine protein kinase
VLKSIGVGGMGMVFLAKDTHLQRRAALKVIKPELLLRQKSTSIAGEPTPWLAEFPWPGQFLSQREAARSGSIRF